MNKVQKWRRPGIPQGSVSNNDINETTRLLSTEEDSQETHFKNIDTPVRFWFLFSSVLVSYVLVYFDSFFLSSSHPIITSYFQASNAASWLSTVFFLSSTIFGPFYGRLSDLTGRRTMYAFALSIFAGTTFWCGKASSISSFIAARFFCGIGAGGVATMANIILSDIVKIQYRGIYQSYLNVFYGLGCSLGASLGGLLADRLGWRAVFYLQVPLILVLLAFSVWATPPSLGPALAKSEGKSVAASLSGFDFLGAIALTLTVTGLILGINLGGNMLPWTHPIVIISLCVFVFAGTGLIMVERRAAKPLLPLHLLATVPYGNLNWGNLIGAMLSAISNFNLPLFLQAVKQISPTASGLVLVSPLVGLTISSVLVGFAISWTRKLKIFVALGAASQLIGTIACGLLSSRLPLVAIIAMIPWVSTGQGSFFPASTVSTLSLSSSEDQAIVVTTLSLVRNLGSILGVAVSSWILQNLLLMFLDMKVTGSAKDKSSIIHQVRGSVKAISTLPPKTKAQVIAAYEMSLRWTFLSCAVLGLVLCSLVFPIRIPDVHVEKTDNTTRSTLPNLEDEHREATSPS